MKQVFSIIKPFPITIFFLIIKMNLAGIVLLLEIDYNIYIYIYDT